MNVLYKGARMIKDMYNQLNPATLTGAIDVLVIEKEDKELCSSPFHVRFGKLGVLRAKEKLVNITVNEEEVGLHMKLGDQGEAFFVVEADDEEVPLRLLTSPLPSRPSSPYLIDCNDDGMPPTKDDSTMKRKRRKRRKKRSLTSSSFDSGFDHLQPDTNEEEQNKKNINIIGFEDDEDGNQPMDIDSMQPCPIRDCQGENFPAYERLCTVFSDSEVPQGNLNRDLINIDSPFSDSETVSWNADSMAQIGWDWGELPDDRGGGVGQQRFVCAPSQSRFSYNGEKELLRTCKEIHGCVKSTSPLSRLRRVADRDQELVVEASEALADPKSTNIENDELEITKLKHPAEGLYLDEILDLEPGLADLYFLPKNKEEESLTKGTTSNNGVENSSDLMPQSSSVASDAGVDSGTDCLVFDETRDSAAEASISPMTVSLCGGKLENGKLIVDEGRFKEKLVTYDQFLADPMGVTHNPELIILLGEHYYDWETAGPLLLSVAAFGKPLSQDTVERIMNKQMKKKVTETSSGGRLSWLWRRTSHRESTGSAYSDQTETALRNENAVDSSIGPKVALSKSYSASATVMPQVISNLNEDEESSSCEDEIQKYAHDRREFKRAQTVQSLFPVRQEKSMKKTTRLSSCQLKSLNLKPGANTISFSVTSQYQGTSRCYATVYLWKYCDKLVVSDIDGTITKSDVFGQILPVVGKDWTQGGVAQLYHNISKNGYKFIYLSARAIGQAGMTKGYLNWINQRGVSLPPGPLFLTPTSLMRAFHTEVIEKKPEIFKIQCLHDITALFPSHTRPLVAGFGNKANDVMAYAAVGIPKKRIFTINHKGELKQEDLQTYTTSYSELGNIVDTFFPALDSQQCKEFSDTHEFSTFNYWRSDLPDITDDLGAF